MKNNNSATAVVIGVGAGLGSALLFASLVGGSVLTVPLFAASPLPIMAAGIGFGPVAAVAAVVSAALVLVFELGTPAALVSLGAAGLPGLVLSGLVERDEDGVWFPAGRITTIAAVIMAIATALGALGIGFDPIRTGHEVVAAFREMLVAAGTPATQMPDATAIEPLIFASVRLMPAFFPAFWTLVLALDLAIAVRILRRFGRVERPREDLAMIEISPIVGLVFAAAFAASFVPGSLGVLASIAAGAAFAPLFLVGMGLLTDVTRASDMRWILRATAYGLVLLFPVAALVMALAGLAETFLGLRGRSASGGADRS